MSAVTPQSTPASEIPPSSGGYSPQMLESAAARIAWLAPVASIVIIFVQVFQFYTQPALAVVWMLLGGLRHLPVVLATVFVADILVRQAPAGYAITALTSFVLAAGYAGVAAALQALLGGAALRSTRHLTMFVSTVVVGIALCSGR